MGCAPRRASLTYGELSSSSLLLCILLLQVGAFVNQSPSMATGLAPGGTRDYDTREFDVCRPWKGERGDAFLHIFRPAFLNGLLRISDDWSNLQEHLHGLDPGGNDATAPAHAGAAAAIAQSERAYRVRSGKLKSRVWIHCLNAAIRAEIDSECEKLRLHVAVGGAGNPAPADFVAGMSQGQGLAPISRKFLAFFSGFNAFFI